MGALKTKRGILAMRLRRRPLVAVAVAALTIYDMIKAVDKHMTIGEIRVVEKRGGRSGDFRS